jgi:hypothetical protein
MSDHRTTSVGFTLLYCALMAVLIVAATPHLDGWRLLVAGVLLLPCALIGSGVLIYGKLTAAKELSWIRLH